MSADEIIKHIPEIASVTKVAIGAVPFTAIVKRMLGPAADEVAQMWADKVKLWRFERQASCVKKAEKMLQDAGIAPHTVSPKILFPLLEGASLEENEDLHTMWAALLANASSPDHAEAGRPGFIAILTQMTPDEAAMLNWIHDHAKSKEFCLPYGLDQPISQSTVLAAYASLGFGMVVDRTPTGKVVSGIASVWQIEPCLSNLEAAQLIRSRYARNKSRTVSLTYLGYLFVDCCREPRPKPKS
jgi:Abortive infection alpha